MLSFCGVSSHLPGVESATVQAAFRFISEPIRQRSMSQIRQQHHSASRVRQQRPEAADELVVLGRSTDLRQPEK